MVRSHLKMLRAQKHSEVLGSLAMNTHVFTQKSKLLTAQE